MINKNCFFGDKYYRGAYSKPHRQSQEAKAAFDRNDTTYIDWEQRLQIGLRYTPSPDRCLSGLSGLALRAVSSTRNS